ncbi:MAG: phosphonatase-like hydrolase [Armatimonadaceae bacterium]
MAAEHLPDRPALVVFDMAGTTVYDEDGIVARCLVEAMESGGFVVEFSRALSLMGIPKPEAIVHLLPETMQHEPTLDQTVTQLHQAFLERMLRYYRENPAVTSIAGTEEVFRTLRTEGIKVALDTGFSRDILDTIVARLHWESLLDATVASDEVQNGRPHPDMVFYLMHQLGITDAAQVAKVGDTPVDLQEGLAAGCQWNIGVWEGSHTREQLQGCPHTHLIPNIAHLPALWNL